MPDNNDMTATETRLRNARALAEQAGGLPAFEKRISRSQSQVQSIIGPNPTKGIGNKLARHIEQAFGKDVGWLDRPHWAEGDESEALLLRYYRAADDAGKAFIMRAAENEALYKTESSHSE